MPHLSRRPVVFSLLITVAAVLSGTGGIALNKGYQEEMISACSPAVYADGSPAPATRCPPPPALTGRTAPAPAPAPTKRSPESTTWLVKNRKNYNAIGEERRFEIFKDNLLFINEHNSVEGRSFKVGLNRFADLTNDEYRAMFVGGRIDRKARLMKGEGSNKHVFRAGDKLPESVSGFRADTIDPTSAGGCLWIRRLLRLTEKMCQPRVIMQRQNPSLRILSFLHTSSFLLPFISSSSLSTFS